MNTSAPRKRPTLLQYFLSLFIILIMMGAVFFGSRVLLPKSDPQADRERLIISTSMVALDQHAPGVSYPETTDGWVVSENPDGTISASSPNLGAPVFVMLVENQSATGDGDRFIPYFVKASDKTYLDLSYLYDPYQQSEIVPSQPLSEDLKALIASFPADHVLISKTDAKVTVLVYDEDLSSEVLSALSTQTTPENWAELTAQWEADALSISQNAPGQNTVFSVVSDADSSTIFATFINGKQTYNLFSTEESYSDNPPTISLDEFNAIQTGMTYQEVFDIVGSRGEVLSETDLGLGDQYYSAMYMWEGEGSTGANANVMFQGGKVVSKSQFGLE